METVLEPPQEAVQPLVEQEQMEIPENQNPKTIEDIMTISPEEEDIMEEILRMDSFREHQLDVSREMRGYTSDCL